MRFLVIFALAMMFPGHGVPSSTDLLEAWDFQTYQRIMADGTSSERDAMDSYVDGMAHMLAVSRVPHFCHPEPSYLTGDDLHELLVNHAWRGDPKQQHQPVANAALWALIHAFPCPWLEGLKK